MLAFIKVRTGPLQLETRYRSVGVGSPWRAFEDFNDAGVNDFAATVVATTFS